MAAARRAAVIGTSALLAVAVPNLLVQAYAGSGQFGADIGATLLTAWGHAFLVRLTATSLVLLLALRAWNSMRAILFVAAAVVLATFTASGHGLAQPSVLGRVVAVAADFVHLLAAAAWIGGVFVLAMTLWPMRRSRDPLRAVRIQRLFLAFTPLAILCVVTIVGRLRRLCESVTCENC